MQKQFPPNGELFMDSILTESRPAISTITEIELLCWKTDSQKDIDILKSFIADSFVFELEQMIKEGTAQIRKKYNIKLPDAIIAATATLNDLTLITRNTKYFQCIDNLKLLNPFEI